MRISRLIVAAVLLFVLMDIALAATLHGNIYDIELNELNGVVVEVNSEPAQRYLSKDGAYSFELNTGDYEITAIYKPDKFHEYTTKETIYIKNDGDFVYDLFLFPGFDSESEAILGEPDLISPEDTDVDLNGGVDGLTVAIIAVAAIIILLAIYFIIGHFRKKRDKEELEEVEKVEKQAKKSLREEMDDASLQKKPKKRRTHEELADIELKNVIKIIKKAGGRITQKEIRKQIPLSEAKISLMISELEHKKIVQKVKKGRGNILIINK